MATNEGGNNNGGRRMLGVRCGPLWRSRRLHVRAFRAEKQEHWFARLESAFMTFGGVPQELLMDNLSGELAAERQAVVPGPPPGRGACTGTADGGNPVEFQRPCGPRTIRRVPTQDRERNVSLTMRNQRTPSPRTRVALKTPMNRSRWRGPQCYESGDANVVLGSMDQSSGVRSRD